MILNCELSDRLSIHVDNSSLLEVHVSDVIEAIKRPPLRMVELAELVVNMRHAQTEYFRTRSSSALEDSKRKERKVDEACRAILDGQKKLF